MSVSEVEGGLLSPRPVVGLIPAAGHARRLGELPHSKELLEIPLPGGGSRPVCSWLLDAFSHAGVRQAEFLVRPGKEDIGQRLGTRWRSNLHLAYRQIPPTPGVPFTLAHGLARHREATIVLGFPDILLRPLDLLRQLLAHLESTESDLALALLPSDNPRHADMVELGERGEIRGFQIKPEATDLRYTWSLAAWRPRFTRFFEAFLERWGEDVPERLLAAGELQVSTMIAAAVADGLAVSALPFPDARYLDVGTPEDLRRARATPLDFAPPAPHEKEEGVGPGARPRP